METNGEINVLFFKDEDVIPGLPIWPEFYEKKLVKITKAGSYACTHCGKTEVIQVVERKECAKCKNDKWVETLNCTRTK
ncbi:MAG TPA: hypothetical protein VLZ83_09815 [Edaphocola sp.]|nr:hypothetical protein [Edaphocola sp.]